MTSEMVNVFEIEVHPAADVFPMLSEDELLELANDIAENGLREPLVLQVSEEGKTLLIDGRNRRAACELVKVTPDVRYLNGEDATAFIFSTNIARRHLTAGQRAMAHARLYPAEKGGRGNKLVSIDTSLGHVTLSRARYILARSPMRADEVMSGITSLNAAYEETKKEQAKKETDEQRLKELAAKYPDLANMVNEGQLSLGEAIAAAQKRDEEERQRIAGMNDSLKTLDDALRRVANETLVNRLAAFIRDEKDSIKPGINAGQILDSMIKQLTDLRKKANA
jgi:hypothetical protein